MSVILVQPALEGDVHSHGINSSSKACHNPGNNELRESIRRGLQDGSKNNDCMAAKDHFQSAKSVA